MIEVRFDSNLYSGDAIKRALYRLTDRFAGEVKQLDQVFVCTLHFSTDKSDVTKDLDVMNFKKEVLDQDLREKIRQETESVRNLILAHAFSKTGLIANEQISAH
ncbi:MAG: His-Xaa-Ser system protein HxsD [Pseudomonadota bacterium]